MLVIIYSLSFHLQYNYPKWLEIEVNMYLFTNVFVP